MMRGEKKAGHTKLCIGLQGFACFSKMGRVMGQKISAKQLKT